MVVSSKFTALMAGEDRVTDFGDCISTRTADWRPHDDPCNFGSAELTAKIIDPAGCQPREMHLVKHLLREDEIDSLLCTLDRTLEHDGTGTHANILVEDGVVVSDAFALLKPALEERILPYVRARYGDHRVVVADALMRAYRPEDKRQALAPHFDTSSFATVIIPLSAGQYEGGLYIQEGAGANSRIDVDASFSKGDALIHRFDVMHGVEVTSGSRYSLVLWLSDCQESVEKAATPWLEGAADSGNAYAQFLYAECCKVGRYGIAKDLTKAVDYGHRAANQGHALSQHNLGYLYRSGTGVPQSHERCFDLWMQAAEGGLAAAQYDVAICFAYCNLGVAFDESKAMYWYEQAARQGHADAAMELRLTPWRMPWVDEE